MSISGRKVAIQMAFDSGIRRCPCCNVQLVWRGGNGISHPKNLATVDHIIPKSQGGANHWLNLFVMCRLCNNKRGTKCFVEYTKQKGICSDFVKNAYEKALDISVKQNILAAFTTTKMNQKELRKRMESVSKMVAEYYGEIPESMKCLPLSRTYKIGSS